MIETEWLKRLRSRTGTELLGDDAAVIGDTIITVDMLTEGIDFLLGEVDPQWIGRKALAVNLSDIAAMGGIPTSIVVAVALPKSEGIQLAEQLYNGMEPLLRKYSLTLAGGDTNTWNQGLVISITVLGRVTPQGVLRRGGGKPGDQILVTGLLGGSILEHQFLFEPRIFEALYLNEHFNLHAAIDISDGFSLDLHRLSVESGLGATVYEKSIPVSPAAVQLSQQTGRTPLEHALSDGEDFELLLAVPPEEAEKLLALQPLRKRFNVTLYPVAELTPEPGLRFTDGTVLCPQGFEH
ncbi:MAG: thiamine-phosphate kinase [Planctomycetaceae bacterium]|jgi:thiamine-monophosphate kinase|nr:thiamine-phosphate kinase [Planctomycetaceae bacterium]